MFIKYHWKEKNIGLYLNILFDPCGLRIDPGYDESVGVQ